MRKLLSPKIVSFNQLADRGLQFRGLFRRKRDTVCVSADCTIQMVVSRRMEDWTFAGQLPVGAACKAWSFRTGHTSGCLIQKSDCYFWSLESQERL